MFAVNEEKLKSFAYIRYELKMSPGNISKLIWFFKPISKVFFDSQRINK